MACGQQHQTLVNGGSTVIDVAPSGDQYGFPILNVQGHGSDAGEDLSTRAGYDTHYELVVTDSNAQQVDLATYGISFNSASGRFNGTRPMRNWEITSSR